MRIFIGKLQANDWSNKWNFVDENNVVVGYSNSQDCCERFGYFFVASEPDRAATSGPADPSEESLLKYGFDPSYFKELEDLDNQLDEGGAVAFKLNAEGLPPLYLVLYNAHNGYYSHGFEMSINGENKQKGSL